MSVKMGTRWQVGTGKNSRCPFYFSAVIGISGRAADVSFATKPVRCVDSIHCIPAYLFNTTFLAQLIKIGRSLF